MVTPEIIDIEVPKGEDGTTFRRGLMVIAKIIQNLANNIFFGKEAHMTILNKFLGNNIANVTRFLSDIYACNLSQFCLFSLMISQKYQTPNDDKTDQWTGTISDPTDIIVLHRFFHKHADKIGKELLSLSKPSIDGETSAVTGKRAWDGLCALLVDLGPPLEAPRLSSAHSSEHREYYDFMARHANHDTSSVSHLFVETNVQVSFPTRSWREHVLTLLIGYRYICAATLKY